jgi:hypothetical protein
MKIIWQKGKEQAPNLRNEQLKDHLSILSHHFFAFCTDDSLSPNCMIDLSHYGLEAEQYAK